MPRRKSSVGVADLKAAQKEFGKTFIQVGANAYDTKPEILPTGLPEFDSLLTGIDGEPIGGIPSRGLYLIAGQPGTGKTLVCTHIAATLQKRGLRIAWVDAERRLMVGGKERMEALGLNADEITFVGMGSISGSPVSYILEDTLGVLTSLAAGKAIDVIVIDSVTHLIPRQMAEGALGKEIPFDAKAQAITARALSATLPIMAGACADYGVTCFAVGQLRENPGVMFGRKDYIPGGKSAQFSAAGIFTLSSGTKAYDEEKKTHSCKLTVWKSAVTTDHMKQVELAIPTTEIGAIDAPDNQDSSV